jgi:hypothetical protein
MTGRSDAQARAALAAAKSRHVIATKIAALAPQVEDDSSAQIVLKLAEAYSYLAAEPPRARAG